MALQDPESPPLIDPVVADALAEQQYVPYAPWDPPPEFYDPWTGAPMVGTTEWGGALPAPQQPPPPPPPPVKQLVPGRGDVVEETAAPVPSAPSSTLQPGIPIPTATLDALPVPPPPTAMHEPIGPYYMPASGGAVESVPPPPPPAPPDTRHPEMPIDYLSDEEMGGMLAEAARIDPAAYAGYRASKEMERLQVAANQRAKALELDTKWLERTQTARAEAKRRADIKQMQVDQEAEKMSADGGFWASRSSGQVAAAYISAIIGGIQSVRTGKPNDAIANINTAIDRHVAAQRARLTDKRSQVSQMYSRIGDDYAADEAVRLGAWRNVEGKLLAEQQNYDPRGTKARAIADAIIAARAQQTEIQLRVNETERKRQEDAAKIMLDHLKFEEQRRHALAEEKNQAWSTAVAAKKAETDRIESQRRYGEGGLEDRKLVAEDKKEAAKRAAALEELDRDQSVAGVVAIGPDGKPTYGQLKQPDGSVWHPAKGVHKEILDKREATQTMVDALEDLKTLREEEGGANTKISPSAQYRYNQLIKTAVIAYAKANGQSLADESSFNQARDAVFGGDPSGYNMGDVEGRIESKIGEVKTSYLTKARGAGFGGKAEDALQFVPTRTKPASTTEDVVIKSVIKAPTEDQKDAENQAGTIVRSQMSIEGKPWAQFDANGVPIPGTVSKEFLDRTAKLAENYRQISPRQVLALDDLGAQMRDAKSDADRARIRTKLVEVATTGQTEGIRAKAKEVLVRNGAGDIAPGIGIPATGDQTASPGPIKQGARDEVAAPPPRGAK